MTDKWAVDATILRFVCGNVGPTPLRPIARPPAAAIAKELGVSERTVRNRLHAFAENGLVREARLIPNPNLSGISEAAVFLDIPNVAEREILYERLGRMENVVLATLFHSGLLPVVFRHNNEDSFLRQVRLYREMARDENASAVRIQFPPPALEMNAADWSVLRTFHEHPGWTFGQTANALGLSTRTVMRRTQRLLAGRGAFLFPDLDPGGMRDGIMAGLFIRHDLDDREEIERGLLATCGSRIWHMEPYAPARKGEPTACFASLIAANMAEAHRYLADARRIRVLRELRLELWESTLTRYDAFEELYAPEKGAAAARSSAAP